jgi:hypothetical protein
MRRPELRSALVVSTDLPCVWFVSDCWLYKVRHGRVGRGGGKS